jgi:hypothetical protein
MTLLNKQDTIIEFMKYKARQLDISEYENPKILKAISLWNDETAQVVLSHLQENFEELERPDDSESCPFCLRASYAMAHSTGLEFSYDSTRSRGSFCFGCEWANTYGYCSEADSVYSGLAEQTKVEDDLMELVEDYDKAEFLHVLSGQEKAQDWFFTFGTGQLNARKYVKIFGLHSEARKIMVKEFSKHWAFQYESAEAAGATRFNLIELEL